MTALARLLVDFGAPQPVGARRDPAPRDAARRRDDPLAAENRRIEILVRDAAAPPGAGTGAGR